MIGYLLSTRTVQPQTSDWVVLRPFVPALVGQVAEWARSGLMPGSTYEIRLFATNGTQPISPASEVITYTAPAEGMLIFTHA